MAARYELGLAIKEQAILGIDSKFGFFKAAQALPPRLQTAVIVGQIQLAELAEGVICVELLDAHCGKLSR